MAVPLEDCCGLGCNNCILDRFIDPRPVVNDKVINLFNRKGYQKFEIKEIRKVRQLVYQFCFELKRDKLFTKDEHLLAPPISYLMLRAPRDDDMKEFNSELFEDFKDLLICPKDDDEDDDEQLYRSPPQRHDKATPEIYISRKYTPFEVNEQNRTFKIIVKLEPFGKMSRYLTSCRVGAVCEFKGPFEAFNYVHESIENYIVFTQGKFTGCC
jgi:NAD(P)H-flavin reductase